ncbi:MAG: radical SAM protein [Lachnospiraceae bacterium]|nr:radical SAM protein [Lachnospiraceae bacterium]
MKKEGPSSLFSFHPDPEAVKSRMIREVGALYRLGLKPERAQPVYSSYKGLLNKFYLYPTFDCPLRCPYCYAEGGERKSEELPPEDLLRITQEAIDAGYRVIVLVGGEPLVYKGFPAYLDGLAGIDKKGARLVLRTSFAFPVKDRLMEIICRVFDEITVSIDGDEQTNDAFRGKGSWQYATRNAERAVSLGGCVSVSGVMGEEQAGGAPGEFLRGFCRRLGIRKLVINTPVPMGRAAGTHIPYYEWRSEQKASDSIRMSCSCGLGRSLYMEPDGKLYPCYAWCSEEHLLGDLSKESLQSVLDRGELLTIINTGVDTNRKCRSCAVRYLCGGMCKIWSNNKHDINSGDFDCTAKKQGLLAQLEKYGILQEGQEQHQRQEEN